MLDEIDIAELKAVAYEMRKDILRLCHECGPYNGHLGGCMSAVELLAVLYRKVMNLMQPHIRQNWCRRDRFVMSKGHAGLALYAALRQVGLLCEEDFARGIRGQNSILFRHPKYNPDVGIECSVGSLGMGVGFAVGLAESLRRDNIPARVYAMLGDGECNEGAVWEAIAYATHRELANLCVIVDCNGLQLDGSTRDVLNMVDLGKKFSSFGFEVRSVDGHDFNQIYEALICHPENRPSAIIAKTIKGRGVSFAENRTEWHDNYLSDDLYAQALSDLQPYSLRNVNQNKETPRGRIRAEEPQRRVLLPSDAANALAKMGSRKTVGWVAGAIAKCERRFALLYSDCGNRIGVEDLQRSNPVCCYEMGISEQNQLAVAAALAKEGFDVFATAYAPFITARVLDHIRSLLGYMKCPVKLIGLSAGFSSSDLGATHVALEDVADMRAIPNMQVVCPADCLETAKALIALRSSDKPAYIRLTQNAVSCAKVYEYDYDFVIGKAITLREGSDILMIGCGSLLSNVLNAAESLAGRGVSCRVVNMHTIKPLDIDVFQGVDGYRLVVTIEEHSIIGGLGSSVAEFLAERAGGVPLLRLGTNDRYFVADTPESSIRTAGLDADSIAKRVLDRIEKCKML